MIWPFYELIVLLIANFYYFVKFPLRIMFNVKCVFSTINCYFYKMKLWKNKELIWKKKKILKIWNLWKQLSQKLKCAEVSWEDKLDNVQFQKTRTQCPKQGFFNLVTLKNWQFFSKKIEKSSEFTTLEKKPRNFFVIKWRKISQKKAVFLNPKPYTLTL